MNGQFIDRPQVVSLFPELNLYTVKDRFVMVKILLNALRIFKFCIEYYPKNRLPFSLKSYTTTNNSLGTSMKCDNDLSTGEAHVYKKIKEFPQYLLSNHTNLLELYSILKSKKIRHTYKDFDFHYNGSDVLCISKLLEDIQTGFDILQIKLRPFKYSYLM